MDTTSPPFQIQQCYTCPGDTEYYCESCISNLCQNCKENHVKDLKSIDHNVLSYRNKYNNIAAEEIVVKIPGIVYKKNCESCQVSVCDHSRKHMHHRQHDVRTPYETKLKQHLGTIQTIRREALFCRPLFLPRIKADIKTCHAEFSLYQSNMLAKTKTLKNVIDYIQNDFMHNILCDFDFKHRCSKQKIEMKRHIIRLQRYAPHQPAFHE